MTTKTDHNDNQHHGSGEADFSDPDEALALLTMTRTAAETWAVLRRVPISDRRVVADRAGLRRQRRADALARAAWNDEPLPFGGDAA